MLLPVRKKTNSTQAFFVALYVGGEGNGGLPAHDLDVTFPASHKQLDWPAAHVASDDTSHAVCKPGKHGCGPAPPMHVLDTTTPSTHTVMSTHTPLLVARKFGHVRALHWHVWPAVHEAIGLLAQLVPWLQSVLPTGVGGLTTGVGCTGNGVGTAPDGVQLESVSEPSGKDG